MDKEIRQKVESLSERDLWTLLRVIEAFGETCSQEPIGRSREDLSPRYSQ